MLDPQKPSSDKYFSVGFGNFMFQSNVFEHCFDNQVTTLQVFVIGSGIDALHYRIGLGLIHLAALNSFGQQLLRIGLALLGRLPA